MDTEDKDYEMTDAPQTSAIDDVRASSLAHTSSELNYHSPPNTFSKPPPFESNTSPPNTENAVGSLGITDPEDPFFVHSNNSPTFKYKYPQAKPTPEGEDDAVWNRIYTAADSRMYNKHHKSANESRKYRESGETRTLSLRMLVENKAKHARAVAAALAGGQTYLPKAAPKPKNTTAKYEYVGIKKETPEEPYDLASGGISGGVPMSISEKIKSEGRKRKAPSDAPTSQQGTPAPPTAQKHSSPAPKLGSPAPSKTDKPTLKKKGTAASVRKFGPSKKAQNDTDKVDTPSSSRRPSNSPVGSLESNDGGEYCICRGPDDHRMMVFCDGGCEDWYHCSCVNIDEEDAKELLDRYICPKCTTNERKTTWKRICRYINCNNGCRRAARVNQTSKYCSERHLNAFFEWCYKKLRGDDAPSMGSALNRQEVADLLVSISTVEELHALGKKPRLAITDDANSDRPVGLSYITTEEQSVIDDIQQKKRVIEAQREGYINQRRLLLMIDERSQRAIKHPSVEIKAICGYDNRLAMNEAEFKDWYESEEGQSAFKTGVLGPRTDDTRSLGAHVPYPGQTVAQAAQVVDALDNICFKPPKKCKHNTWREIHNGDFSVMIRNLTQQLNRLTEQEKEIIDDAETREATKNYYADNVTVQLF
ncbi:PHD transcription factor [Diplocarpon rosae]|nr:PHD transcription factor [Diplocarpon rosae]